MARLGGGGLVAGLLLTASLPPFGWWPLGLLGVAVLARLLLAGGGWRRRLAIAGACGLGLYGPGLWWVTEFHALGWLLLVLLEAGVLGLAVSLVPAPRLALALPSALVLSEAVRGRWPFGGLPLAGLDLGQVGGPLLPVARVGGHLLLVFVVGLIGVGLALASRGRVGRAAVCVGLGVVLAAAGAVAFDGADRGSLEVATVQGGGVRGLRAVDADPTVVLEAHVVASRQVPPSTALVVWPENVVDVEAPLAGSGEEAQVSAVARSLGVTLVAGVTEDVPERPRRFRNAAVVFLPDGRTGDRYEKVHRVPFGEYVPYRSFFDRLADLSIIPSDAIAGRGPGVVDTPVGRLAVTISYEVFFADRARSGTAAGGRLLLVPTNASSYTTSQVPTQELAAARLRAVETGRWVVQAAPTGYSAVVDQRGRVHERGPLGARAVLSESVRLRSGRTPAVRLGDAPVTVVAAAFLALAWLRTRKSE